MDLFAAIGQKGHSANLGDQFYLHTILCGKRHNTDETDLRPVRRP